MVQHPRQNLSILNETPKNLEGPGLLHELVPRSSDASAIDFLEYGIKRRKFSYQQLHALSNTLAQRIIELTETLENASSVVPVLLPQSPELYIVLLAILKAGKAFCPLNLDTPDERLKFILSDISADLLITNVAQSDRARSIRGIQTICADRELLRRNEIDAFASPHINSTDTAYVLYTSGSTGLPKAVSVSHRAVTQSLLAHDSHIPNFARFLQFAAPTFDVSIFEIFFPWFRGRTLAGCLRERMLEDLPEIIGILEADAAELTPTVVGNLLHGRKSVPGLRLLLTIGEMLTQHVVDEYGGSETQRGILYAMYGPTEAAIHCTLQARFSAFSSTGNIGYPLETVSTFIIAPSEGPHEKSGVTILPWGEAGELALGGHQIADEYLNRPELTAASFIDHPDFGRLYRTGDRARFQANGTIECLGRIVAGQVKLRGQRVELGEVEQVIMKLDGCRLAVATIIDDSLVAFCAIGTAPISRQDVLQVCKEWLPNFMVPSDVFMVTSMPQLPSGKIDKRSLETAYSESLPFQDTHSSLDLHPSDQAALSILHIAQDCLGRRLSLSTNLTAAGLDSLRAIRVASRLRNEGFDLSAVDVLTSRTLYDLIKSCKHSPVLHGLPHLTFQSPKHDINLTDPELGIESSLIDFTTPCTPLQEAMLAETISRPDAYCNWIELELTVTRTHNDICTAVEHLARENSILRSGFYRLNTGKSSFVQITWKSLEQAQVQRVSEFERSYTLDSPQAFLRPFRISVQDIPHRQRIMVQIHHALYDGWSFDLLLDDFDKLLRQQTPTRRPQFRDVSQYYVHHLATSGAKDDARYWEDLLRDYVPTTLVNYNGEISVKATVRTYRGQSSVKFKRLSERARDLAINPQVFFQTAIAYILSLYTGSSDVVFGNVTSGRTVPVTGIEDVIGPCIASLPCRLDFETFASALEALQKVQRLNRDGLNHCALPLRDIARLANVKPGTRLFDVLFVWQQTLSPTKSKALAARVIDSADDLEFKLTLELEPRDDCISLSATFDSSAIPETQVKHLVRQVDEIVIKLLEDSNCTMTEVARSFTDSSLSIANPDYHHTCDDVSLSHAVETWAITSPEKEAIIFGHVSNGALRLKNSMTYSSLNTRANQLARLLSETGVGQDQLICIMMEKSIDLYVAILAVLKLGSGYLPLVPDAPVERVKTILHDAGVVLCITDSTGIYPLKRSYDGKIIDLSSTVLSTYSEDNVNTPYNGSHIAYAVFTSGSTGTPKGVLVTQKNLLSNLRFLSGLYPASPDSRMLQSCSQAFDVSVFEIFYAWHVGMSLCTATKDDLFRDFEASINSLGATHLSLTPTVAALVNPDNVPKVQFLVTAGEALTERVRRQWAGRGLYQGYGPSETTNICTVRPSVTSRDLINNIGPPFSNTSAFVLHPSSDILLPRGAVGELCFGGEQVFRGYLNQPELNAAKLIEIAPYGRIYRSGDMGRLLPDDCILSAGRSDDQVKIRGQRVELGEITSIVLDDVDVLDCTTLLLSAGNESKTLVTFWVHKDHKHQRFTTVDGRYTRLTVQRILDSLTRRLPAYMLPSYLVTISKLPMTAQAKIDKRLLQASFNILSDSELALCSSARNDNDERQNQPNGHATPLSGWEKQVAETLAHVLEIDVGKISRMTSFFSLGLDSVSAIRFCHSLRQFHLADLSVAEVLQNSTIKYLGALHVDRANLSTADTRLQKRTFDVFSEEQRSSICASFHGAGLEVENIAPCTPLQEAMLASSVSTGTSYSNTMVFDIKGDINRLRACWDQAQIRHGILRTSFVPSDHPDFAYAQVVLKDPKFHCGQLDTLQDVQFRMDVILQDLIATHRPPLYLATCVVSSTMKLVFSCHHALYDGIAITRLLEEIQEAYHGHELPPTIPYDRYLQHLLSQKVAEADEFWSKGFADFEPTYFPDLTGKIQKGPAVTRSLRRNLQLPLSAARAASKDASASVLALVQAGWVKLLHYYTGEEDICFGNVVSGRGLPEEGLDRLVAPCFNTLPMRAKFDFSKPNSMLVQFMHRLNVDSFPYQLTAVRRVQSMVLQNGGRLFDTLLILQQSSKPLDDSIWTLEDDAGEMDLPIVCEVRQEEHKNALTLTLHYTANLLTEADAQIVAQTLDYSLQDVCRNVNATAGILSCIPTELKAMSNLDFERLPSTSGLLHVAFEQNASSLRSDAIALDFVHADGAHTTWSYRTLNSIANRIAYRLMLHEIGVEDIVPIHISKSPLFYASILGVLKAGAAFAPVHPDLPDARKELMVTELSPKVVLSTSELLESAICATASVLDVSDLEASDQDACENPHIKGVRTSSLAYCLYTSGSTGTPKAVSVEHRAPIQTVESSRSLVPWTASSRLLQYAAVTFDMCYYDCFMAWTFGFTLCAAEQHSMFDNLSSVINSLGITLLDLTPSVAASLSRVEVPSVDWLYCIGEAMSGDVSKEWNDACVNSYGPTEAAFCTTMFPVSQDTKLSVIGRPYPSTSFAVFSPHSQQPLPLLSTGELYIGGAQLARGYFGRPELTEERFVFRCGQRFYKSGDIVRMLSNGNFEFIGRADDQVKIRGLRVELGEINQILYESHSRIRSATTHILRKDVNAKQQLVCFLATGEALNLDEEHELRIIAAEAAKTRLPAYMVPQFYVLVDQIPKSPAGKVDKKSLAEIFQATANANLVPNGANDNHEWTNVELSVRGVFSRLSHTPLDEILPEMTIYQLGLDSISAVQVASALRKRAFEVSASDIMRYPTCTDLAKHLANKTQSTGSRTVLFDFQAFDRKYRAAVLASCEISDWHVEAIRPCTPLQQSMVSQFIAKDGRVYYNSLRLRLERHDMDLTKLKNAWRTTMRRQPILRTGFAQVQDEQHPFVMIQYAPETTGLPWSESFEAGSQPPDSRLAQIHRPSWSIQASTDKEDIFLDLSIFHALFDAHSLQLIFEDVVCAYNDVLPGGTTPLDSVLNEMLRLTGKQNEQTEQFWSDLGNRIVPTRFPNMAPLRLDVADPVMLTKVSSMSAAEIEKGCRASNVTLQAAGITGWSTILSAYTGEQTVTLGVVLSGRMSEEARSAVFPCINTVPFVCTIAEDKKEMLKSVMALNAEVHKHQFTPLKKIQRLMGLSNDSLFDSLFAFQKTLGISEHHDLWTVTEEKATTEYPISIELELKQGVLEYRLTYLPHIIPHEQAATILEQLDHVMREYLVADDPSALDPLLQQSLYSITPPKEAILSSEIELLHQFVESTSDLYPDRRAFEFVSSIDDGRLTKKTWSYRELDAEGNRVAHLLSSYNIQQGGLVGVCFDKCPEASFAILGILKAGCAFVAIDPSAPSARQTFIVEDSGIQAVLTMSIQSTKFKEGVRVPVLDLDNIETRAFPSSRPSLQTAIVPRDRSYCLYTSGTTGTPKGCELTHENAVQALLAFQRLFAGHWDTESRWLQFASFHFDVSVLEQYWSWSVGICVVSAPRDLIFEDLANSIHTLGITHIDLTPSLAQILHPNDVPGLCKGVFITGGESLKQEILDVWGPKGVIYNGYGPTEATIGCTMYPRVPANGKPSNIGPQFDNVGSYVLKPGSHVPVLRGAIGELCVSGKLVGKGYLNRPDLTNQRFTHLNSFNERVYRTGDLVRILHDGTFDFLGRADDQVKLRGQRLEIGEINSVIRQASRDVTDVATLVLKHPKQQKEQLVAFVVIGIKSPREPKVLLVEAPNLSMVKEACHDRLSPYMVPTHFVPLASMPLNINNKADAKQLKNIYEALSSSDLQQLSVTSTTLEGVWTEEEKKLRSALAEALGIDEKAIEKGSSFYELGMDSISVIGVSRTLRQAGFAQATAAILMRHATINRLARSLANTDPEKQSRGSLITAQQAINATQHRYLGFAAQVLGVDSRDVECLAPCTPLQQGMIARFLDSDDGLYLNTFRFGLANNIDISRLHWAWDTLFKDTQILRTAFVNTEDGHVQVVLRNVTLPWVTCDLSNDLSSTDCVRRLRQRWLAANRAELCNLFELQLVGPSGDQILLVNMFHGLYDGNSIELLFENMWKLYHGINFEALKVPTFHQVLPYGPLQVVEGAKKFWENHLAGLGLGTLPTLTKEPMEGTVTVTRDLGPLSGYHATRKKLNVTAQAMAQACWLQVLQEYIGASVTTGIVVSGRNLELEHADSVIGPMFNTIPYQYRTQAGDTWASAIARVHDFNTAALPYQHTPLRETTKWCKRGPGRPLFDALFVYQIAQTEGQTRKFDRLWKPLGDKVVADYPLAIEIEQSGFDKLSLSLVTQGHISSMKTSNELLDRFEEALQSALADPSATVNTALNFVARIPEDRTSDPHADMDNMTGFIWSEDAAAIRDEILALTGLELGSIDESTSILKLGLDSIDAIKLSSRLKRRGHNLPVSGIMRGLTIKNMARHVKSARVDERWSKSEEDFARQKLELRRYVESLGLNLKQIDNILPLTPLQEAMVADMIASDYKRYYNFDVSELAKDTNLDRLIDAWHTVITSTPILRTAFIEIDDPNFDSTYAQVVVKPEFMSARVERQRVGIVGKPDFSAIFENLRRAATQSHKLEPPIKLMVLETSGSTYQILSIAHALYDGWSLGLLHEAVSAAYRGLLKTSPSCEIALANILSQSGAEAAIFWKNYLTGMKPTYLPHRQLGHMAERVYRKELPSDAELHDITKFARNNNLSLQTLGQTAFAITLATYVGSFDVTFGCVLSGRDDVETSEVMFPTMNTVAIRTVLHGTGQELLQYVQSNFSDIKQRQHYPLRKVSILTAARGKLFDSLFIYQKGVVPSTRPSLYHSIESQSDVEFSLCVEMEVVNDKLLWRCAAKEEVMDLDGAQGLLRRLDHVLRSIMQSPGTFTIASAPSGPTICGLPMSRANNLSELKRNNTEDRLGSPLEPTNEKIARIRDTLAAVAQVPKEDIRLDMSIFHVGLDSISAIKVSSILRKQGINISVGQMLKAGTIEKMASLSDGQLPLFKGDVDTQATIKSALRGLDQAKVLSQENLAESQVDQILPLTAGQTYMVSMWVKSNGANFYPEFSYNVEGNLDWAMLRDSWQEVANTHSILRTHIVATHQSDLPYVQVVLKEVHASLTNTTDVREDNVAKAIREHATLQPWVHMFASRTASGWSLRLKIHHALYDGVSLPLLMQRLQEYCNGDPRSVSAQTLDQYTAIAHSSSAAPARKKFWSQYLEGVVLHPSAAPHTALNLRTELYRPRLLQISNLESIARYHGISTQALFLAAYASLHASRSGEAESKDVILGIYLANRSLPIPNLSTAAIPTVNLLPIRIRRAPELALIDTAIQVQRDLQALSEAAIATTSLFEISEWTGVKVDTFINFLNLPDVEQMDQSDKISLIHETGWQEDVSRVVGSKTVDNTVPEDFVNEHINAAYLPAVDVEATIRNGMLAVGVFAPGDMLSLEEGEKLIEELRVGLEALGEA